MSLSAGGSSPPPQILERRAASQPGAAWRDDHPGRARPFREARPNTQHEREKSPHYYSTEANPCDK